MALDRFIWRGSAEGEVVSDVVEGRLVIKNLTITNRTQKVVNLNLAIRTSKEGTLNIAPLNLKLGVGESFEHWNVHLDDRDEIIIRSSGRVDYYFSMGTSSEAINR